MEKVIKRYQMAVQTLATLRIVLDKLEHGVPQEYYLEVRDSAIQRFKYSIDTFWKFVKIYLQEHLKVPIEASSPRAILKEALGAGIISDQEFQMLVREITNRNETSHAYNEPIACQIAAELGSFYVIMHTILSRIECS